MVRYIPGWVSEYEKITNVEFQYMLSGEENPIWCVEFEHSQQSKCLTSHESVKGQSDSRTGP